MLRSHWRKSLVITPLLVAALLVCVAGFARAGHIIGLQIQSPTSSFPFQYARPGGTVAVTARVTLDATDGVWMNATIGTSTCDVVAVGEVEVPGGESSGSRDFSVLVTLSGSEGEGNKDVTVQVYTDGDSGHVQDIESNAVYVDATPPTVILGSTPTTPTTNPRPTWTWSGSDALSGLDYYIVTLDGELPFQTTGTSFTPSSNLADGAHVLKVKAVDKAGNVGTEQSFSAAIVDTAAPALTLETPSPTNQSPQTWSWSAPAGATGYRVSVNGGGWTDVHDAQTYQTTFAATGTYTFGVKAYDWLGNEGSEATGNVVIDVTPPAVPTGLTVTTPTTDKTPTWSWTAVSGAAGYSVRLDGAIIRYVATPARYTHAEELGDGTHTLEVRSYDALGNKSAWCTAVTVTVDTLPPEVPGMPAPEHDPTNDNTPTWTWPAIADAAGDFDHYNVYEDGAFKTAAATATYTSGALSDGLHVLEVTSVDDLGNESARSTQGHVLIDTAKPAAPVMNPMAQYSKPGPITFSWSVSDDLLEVKYNFQYSLDGGSTWEPTVMGLTAQSYAVDAGSVGDGVSVMGKAMAYDAVGNESDYSASASTIIDGTGPVVSAVSPTTAYRTNNPRPTWEWSATETGSGVDYYIVTLDEELPFRTTGASFTPSSDLFDGVHTLTVQGVGKVGNEGTPYVFAAVTIDTTPPAIPGIPRTTSPTRNTSPVWVWAGSGEDAASYNVYLDDEFVANVEGPTYTTEGLSEGTHHLQVTALDSLGNESDMSATGHVVIDLTAPAVPEMMALPLYTNADSLTFVWSTVGDGVKYDLEYRIGTADPVVVPGILVQEHTVTIAGAGSGTVVSGKVRAYDAVGNVTEYSDSVSTTMDRTGPVVTLGALPGSPRRNRRPTWTWSGSDALSGLDYYVVTLDGEPPIMTEGTSYTPASDLPDGEHILKVYGVDNLGNVGTEESFAAVTIDTTPPAIPGIPRTTSPTRNTSPVWAWAPSGEDAVSYNVYLDDEFAANAEEPTYTTEGLSEGTHHLQVTALDALGNESDMSATGHVVIDLTAPEAPAAPIPDINPTNQASQLWSWDYVEGAARFDVQTSADGETWSEPENVGNALTFTTEFAGDGITGYLRVRAIDALGNVGGWSVAGSVYVDTVAPEAPTGLNLTDPAGALIGDVLYTADATPKVKWNGPEDAAHYDVWLDGKYWVSTGGTEYEFSEGLPDGVHSVKVASVDALGNSDGYSDELVFVVDTTPPETPGMPRTESPTANRRPTWTWNATSGAVTYRVFLDGVAQPADQPNGTPQPGTTFTPAADLADGWHDLQVTAIDALGNESAKSAVGSVLIDSIAPVVPDMAHLPAHTGAIHVVFRWASIGEVAGYNFSYIVGDGEEWTTVEGITTQSYVVKGPDGRDLRDGEVVQGRVQAYDSLGNTSGWSGVESTTIDLAGPAVSITSPAAAKNTNLSAFTWQWTGSDGERGSGVQGYWVKLNDETWSWTTEPVFTPSHLRRGANVLRVKGVDNLGNEGAVTVAPTVTLVDVAIFDVMPAPGEHPINEASTIVFSVAGLYDGRVEVLLSNKPIQDAWRLVTIVNTPGLAKFYVLLDDAVMQPGPLTVTLNLPRLKSRDSCFIDRCHCWSYTVSTGVASGSSCRTD